MPLDCVIQPRRGTAEVGGLFAEPVLNFQTRVSLLPEIQIVTVWLEEDRVQLGCTRVIPLGSNVRMGYLSQFLSCVEVK